MSLRVRKRCPSDITALNLFTRAIYGALNCVFKNDAWSTTLFPMSCSRILGSTERSQTAVSVPTLYMSVVQLGRSKTSHYASPSQTVRRKPSRNKWLTREENGSGSSTSHCRNTLACVMVIFDLLSFDLFC